MEEEKLEIVRNMNTLKAMKKRGLIKFDAQTGTKVTSLYDRREHTCYYIWDYGDKGSRFIYKGNEYLVKYVDGSFKPYVFKVIKDKQ